jgi:WD40 repeat protein
MESPIVELRGHIGAVHCVQFSAFDNDLLVSAGEDGLIRIWDTKKMTQVALLKQEL